MKRSVKKSKIVRKKVVEKLSPENTVSYKPVSPDSWVLPNKKRFPSWINERFIQYRLTEDIQKRRGEGFSPFPYQQFIRDYMQLSSPYRGILLYHGLGSGKTCSAIIVSEQMRKERKILVLLPASLKHNFIGTVNKEGLKCCGAKEYQKKESGNKLIQEHYTFISYNASNTVKQLEAYGSLDDHVIIIDESHKLLSMMANSAEGGSKQGKAIYDMLMNAKNTKIVLLSGTPINTDAFEAGLMANLLRGYIEILTFNMIDVDERKYGRTWALGSYTSDLEKHKEIDYVEINKQARTVSLHLRIKSYENGFTKLVDEIVEQSDKNGVKLAFDKKVDYTAFPESPDDFARYFIDNTDPYNEKLINTDVFKRRLLGLVSYYRGAKPIYYPVVNDVQFINVPMSDYQFAQYVEARDVEQDSERRSKVSLAMATGRKMDSVKKGGLFRIFSREFSNFVFPYEIERPYLKHASIRKPGQKKNNKNKTKITNVLKEADVVANEMMEDKLKLNERYQSRLKEALDKLEAGASTYLRPGKDGLDKYSPKMKESLERLSKSPGKVLVYSNFRTLEGIEIFSKVLDQNGFSRFRGNSKGGKNKYALFTGSEDHKDRVKTLERFNAYENRYGDQIKVLLITSAGAEGLDLKCIRQVHIMEPYWTEIRAQQVIGRAVRVNSHIDLPEKDRFVDVFRYHSVFTKEQEKERKKEPMSTDQYVYEAALVKQRVVDEVLMMFKEMAVDCTLNAFDNEAISCFTFGKDKVGLSYLPNLQKDIVYSQTGVSSKKVKREIVPGGLTSKGKVVFADSYSKKLYSATNKGKLAPIKEKVKVVKRVGIDLDTGEVYDYKAVKSGGNLIVIGRVNEKTGAFEPAEVI